MEPSGGPYAWAITSLIREIEQIYRSDQGLAPYWPSEEPSIDARLRALHGKLRGQYAEPVVLGVGGAGIVLKLIDRELGDQPCALKFPRPVAGQTDLLRSLLDKEIRSLATLRHTSIVRIHSRGMLPARGTGAAPLETFPYYVMDFIAGLSSSKYLRQTAVGELAVARLVGQTVSALAYMHSRQIAHLDLKPDNVLVSADGSPVIADLGTAKRIGPGLPTTVACTYGYVHPSFAASLSSDPSDPNRVKGTLQPAHIDRRWDLYSLGRTILNWLGFGLKGEQLERLHTLSPYARKYLLLMAARMLDGHVDQWLEDRVGLDRRLLKDLAYASAEEVEVDVRKLSGEFSIVAAVPELNAYHPNTLQIAADGPTTYSDRLKNLIHHPYVKRLAAITQLGLVNQVYPTAVHSRLEHSIGTYHNACRFILSLYHDPLSPLFRQVFTPQDIKTLLVAAVLHDVGQYPLAHDLEEIDENRFDHKRVGTEILSDDPADERHVSLSAILEDWGVELHAVKNLLAAKLEATEGSIKIRILHSIIDGPLDADKLDYLRRDSDRLRVPYAQGIDIERILRSLTVIVKPEAKSVLACIGVHEKARVAAEFVAVARYALFSQAYWQHTVRCMKAMLARAVWRLIVECEVGDKPWHASWWTEFRTFVRSLPDSVYSESTTEQGEGAELDGGQNLPWGSLADSSLGAMDAAVVRKLQGALERCGVPEAELLSDLSRRLLYKRLLVFSEDRGDGWRSIVEKWDKLSPRQRLDVLGLIELDLVGKVQDAAGPHSSLSIITRDSASQAILRVEAKRPLILLDVPGNRPGSTVPLYCVVEAQRRVLRKDARAVGEVQPSSVWQKFGSELRERAGKVRVFCAPEIADILEAVVTREWFLGSFDKAVRKQ